MPAAIHPQYPENLDCSQELPDAKYEAFCRAVARTMPTPQAFLTYINPNKTKKQASLSVAALMRKWWIRERVSVLEAQLQQIATIRAPLTRDDVLETICDKFKAAAAVKAETHRDNAEQARALCQYGEMICKLTGAYVNKPGKHEVSLKVKRENIGSTGGADA